jgi:hypothetical protein
MSDSNFEWYLKYFLEREEERFTNNEIKLIIIWQKLRVAVILFLEESTDLKYY